MAQGNLARFPSEQRSSMNVPGSKAIVRLLCKTSPPRRLTTLRSKSEELQFPNCIRPANTQTLLLLLEALGAGAVEAAKGWVESQDSGTGSVGNEALQLFRAREGAGGIDIILSQYDSLASAVILSAWQKVPISTRRACPLQLLAAAYGQYSRDTDVLAQIEYFMAAEALDNYIHCPVCPRSDSEVLNPVSGFVTTSLEHGSRRHLKWFCTQCGTLLEREELVKDPRVIPPLLSRIMAKRKVQTGPLESRVNLLSYPVTVEDAQIWAS